jgi:demethylmenaquinone methyltransferase/2-methoxy-6-polyprenyl-1,4-benzoquinol methylase
MDAQISRVNRTKAEARENYNRLSRWYDWIAGSSEARFRRIGVKALDAQEGEYILEIGFGTGHCLVEFAERVGERGQVFGIDLSDGMAQVANRRLSKDKLEDRVFLCLADGVALPFPSDLFGAVFMSFTLELFDTPEIPRVLQNCRRVLKSEGRLVNVSLAKTPSPGIAERTYEWFHERMPIMVDCRPIDSLAALEGNGFEVLQDIQESMWGLPVQIISAVC